MADAPRYVLGINAYDHDVAACLLRDGAVVVAIAKERVTRIKHASGFFAEAVDYCLETAGIGVDDLSLVVRNCYMLPVGEMERRLRSDHQPYHLPVRERPIALASPLFAAESDRVRTCSHHLAHAYSAFAASPFDRGAVMIVDGVGSYRADVLDDVPAADEVHPLARESESYYRFEGTRLETVKKVWLEPARGVLSDEFYTMAGLGAVYSRVSTYIFGDWNKCGEVMGLAPYGKAGIEPLLHLDGDALRVRDWGSEMCHPNLGLSDVAWQKSPDLPHWQEVAWRVQQDTEEILVQRARRLREVTGERNLCMAGGVALNCVANARVARESGFEKVWIQPAAGDDGIAIGCALYGHLALQGGKRTFVMTSPYTGRASDRFDVDEALRPRSVRFFTRARRPAHVAEATAEILAGGAVIGWLQGGSEIGPGHWAIGAYSRIRAIPP